MTAVSYEFLGVGSIGQVPIDMVPRDEWGEYRFWRAASLAKIALNLEDGRPALNTGPDDDPTIFFFDEKSEVLGAHFQAEFWADRLTHTQLSVADEYRLQQHAGGKVNKRVLPRLVLALDAHFNDIELPSATRDPRRPGVNLNRSISLDDIDPYSRQVIAEILGL